MIQVLTYKVPPLKNNNYLVYDDKSCEAALVDCSSFDQDILHQIQEKHLTLKYILLTHGHFDHILGMNDWFKKNPAPVYIAEQDRYLLSEVNQWLAMLNMGSAQNPNTEHVRFLTDGLSLGTFAIQVIHTPGHTPGGVSYLIDDCLFSGDTLFKHTYGRTDLPGSSFESMKSSLKKLLKLPHHIRVFPGHGAPTTIGEEQEMLREF